ncbi:MAG TPA: carbohydrate ABC transporter permease [Gaiellaceae bacterium]|jgi:multiple sugar transport system permease protein
MPELATALRPVVAGRRSARRRDKARRVAPRALLYVLLVIGALAMLFPFAWMVSTSLKPDLAVFQTPPQLIPKPFQPSNYSTVVHIFPVWRFLINSVFVAVISTTLQVGTSAMAAYAFARLKFRGSGVLFMLYLTTLMVPFQVTIVPLFVEMKYLHFVNSYPGLIVPSIASAYGTFLLRQAFLSLPSELEEAAFVDGAGHWTVFTRIALPLVRPSLATFAVLSFIASWNSFLWPLVIISSQKLMTLPVGLSNLQGEHLTAWNLVMAGATISVLPILLVYLVAQKQIVRGFVLSGVKG